MKKKILKILWHCLFNRSSGRPYTLASVSTLILWLHFMHTLVFTDSILPQFFLSVHMYSLYCNGDHITPTTNAGSVIFFSFFIIQSLYVSLYICTVHFSSFYFISEWNFTFFHWQFYFYIPGFWLSVRCQYSYIVWAESIRGRTKGRTTSSRVLYNYCKEENCLDDSKIRLSLPKPFGILLKLWKVVENIRLSFPICLLNLFARLVAQRDF